MIFITKTLMNFVYSSIFIFCRLWRIEATGCNKNRTSDEYLEGFNNFLVVAEADMMNGDKTSMLCPCFDYKNEKQYPNKWSLLGILNVSTKSRLSFLILITAPKIPNLSLMSLKTSCHPQHDIRDAVLKYAIAHLNK